MYRPAALTAALEACAAIVSDLSVCEHICRCVGARVSPSAQGVVEAKRVVQVEYEYSYVLQFHPNLP